MPGEEGRSGLDAVRATAIAVESAAIAPGPISVLFERRSSAKGTAQVPRQCQRDMQRHAAGAHIAVMIGTASRAATLLRGRRGQAPSLTAMWSVHDCGAP
jgi:hypothetical protein